jgi:hypothetical protein
MRPLSSAALVSGAAGFVYGFFGSPVNPVVAVGAYFTLLVAVGSWLGADARARHVRMVYDWGLLVCLAWPVLLPVYAYRTRRDVWIRLTAKALACMAAPQLGYVLGGVLRIVLGGHR